MAHWSEQPLPGEDSREAEKFQRRLRSSKRADSATSCMGILITLLAALVIAFLITWGISKAHWAMAGILIGMSLIALFCFVMLVTFTVSAISAGTAKRIFKRQERLTHNK